MAYDQESSVVLPAKGRGDGEAWAVHHVTVAELDESFENVLARLEEDERITYTIDANLDPNAALIQIHDHTDMFVLRYRPENEKVIFYPAAVMLDETLIPFPSHLFNERTARLENHVADLEARTRYGFDVADRDNEDAELYMLDQIKAFYDRLDGWTFEATDEGFTVVDSVHDVAHGFKMSHDPNNGYAYVQVQR